jgi:hypothetical protein
VIRGEAVALLSDLDDRSNPAGSSFDELAGGVCDGDGRAEKRCGCTTVSVRGKRTIGLERRGSRGTNNKASTLQSGIRVSIVMVRHNP